MNTSLSNSKNIGLVLSGGGVRGMAHIGLIKAMREFEIEANIVSGSSVGAIVAALYANDVPAKDMLNFFKTTPIFHYHFFTVIKAGFIDTDKFFTIFKNYFPLDTFESLKRELHIVATNLQDGEEEFFNSGELVRPLLASAALPPVFSPVEINNLLYADGGIMNNFPIEPMKSKADYIIGSNVSIINHIDKKDLKNSIKLATRVTNLMIYASSRKKMNLCDLLFEHSAVDRIGVLDKKGIEKAFVVGYDNACRVFEKIKI
ncbi:patatin-like phospholipase family protein [Cellulophaga baltica]|uniref:patatin-like phospholipase family protein n=1 Tax=Cellulophaga TaxID=104264 RepID=UPI001C07967B|nr:MULTISPECIES: patatin-like phospholipase family protein [Cellulophaga]MBU2995955.1 patatin-like phospholipase family protein [Cellulophaga baltica]MDO6767350.1 patatin-like phospholipase family protein [Cellulophaga sp. 1_MG-2023]